MNALWNVRFVAKFDTHEACEAVYLSSPDLRDTKEAKRRATATARHRLEKKLAKMWGENKRFKLTHVETRCVG